MKPHATCRATILVIVTLAIHGCNGRPEPGNYDCSALATRKLSEAEQIKLGETCPRAGPPFKPSPARHW